MGRQLMAPWDAATFAALEQLLALPDPHDLIGRGHRVTHHGEPLRRQTRLLPLLVRWAQWRCLMVDPEPALERAVLARRPRRLLVHFGRHA